MAFVNNPGEYLAAVLLTGCRGGLVSGSISSPADRAAEGLAARKSRLGALVARAAKVNLEDVLSGHWPGDVCPTCGGTGRRD